MLFIGSGAGFPFDVGFVELVRWEVSDGIFQRLSIAMEENYA